MRCARQCAVLAASFAAGCAGPRVGRCPAEGGQPWIEIRSAHYTLKTNLSLEDGRQTALYLERTRAALLASGWPRARPPEGNVDAFVLRDEVEFERLFGQKFAGMFARSDLAPFVLFYGKPANGGWFSTHVGSVLKHELTHHLSAYFLIRQPRWLGEGIACYLETLEISDDGSNAVVGFANPNLSRVLPARAQDVLAWTSQTPADADETRLYAGSWLLVHWMMNERLEQFSDFQQRLIRSEGEDAAWKNAFAGLSSDELNQLLSNYRAHGSYRALTVAVPKVETAMTERTLPDAEVHAIRAHLVLRTLMMFHDESIERHQFARREVDEALRQDPGNTSALRSMSELQPKQREALARRAVAAHPESDEAWLMLANALTAAKQLADEQEQALKKAASLGPQNAIAANNLAFLYATQRRFLSALPLAKRALVLAPWSPAAWDSYAVIALGLKNCDEAIRAESRAIDLIPERTSRSRAKPYVDRLEAFRKECAARALKAEQQ